MEDLFKNDEFFRVLFNAIPASVLIVNSEGRVFRINKATEKLLKISSEEVHLLKGGEVFRCVFRNDHPEGCGSSPHCTSCVIRASAMQAIEGKDVHRQKGRIFIEGEESIQQLNLLVSSAPVNYKEQILALVIVEELSEIVELQGLLPICVSCKSIKDDKGYWTRLEKYIEEHSEAEFTHGLCAKCMEEQYPDIIRTKAE